MTDSLEPRLAVAKWLHAWDNPPPDSWERASGLMHGFYLARADELLALMAPPDGLLAVAASDGTAVVP